MNDAHDELKEIISRRNLQEEAGAVYFARGLDYFKRGLVKKLQIKDDCIEGGVGRFAESPETPQGSLAASAKCISIF